jgi:hypothetical protein
MTIQTGPKRCESRISFAVYIEQRSFQKRVAEPIRGIKSEQCFAVDLRAVM